MWSRYHEIRPASVFCFSFQPCSLRIIWKKNMSFLFFMKCNTASCNTRTVVLCLGRVVRLYIILVRRGTENLDDSWDRLEFAHFSYCVSHSTQRRFCCIFIFCTFFLIQRWLIFTTFSSFVIFVRFILPSNVLRLCNLCLLCSCDRHCLFIISKCSCFGGKNNVRQVFGVLHCFSF